MRVTPEAELDKLINAILPEVRELRHLLHRHPQVRYQETFANRLVTSELDKLGIPYESGIAETGVVAWIKGKAHEGMGKAVGLRADIDALPILEMTGKPYKSENPGFMHACGHDGHTATLLGAARVLNQLKEQLPRPVKLVFQPAEEGGLGAKKMIEAGVLGVKFGGIEVAEMFAFHGWPHLPVGKLQVKPGVMFAMVGEATITIKGQGGHVSNPHLSHDPIVAAAEIVNALQTVVSRNLNPFESAVISVTNIHGGAGASNILPDEVTLGLNMRIIHQDLLDKVIKPHITQVAVDVAKAFDCKAKVEISSHGEPVLNDPKLTTVVENIIRAEFGADNLIEMEHPLMTAEDFAFYGDVVPSCITWVGLRPADMHYYPDLHNSRFDFNDDAIPIAAKLLCRCALEQD